MQATGTTKKFTRCAHFAYWEISMSYDFYWSGKKLPLTLFQFLANVFADVD
jgi:hypothetical protein